MNVPSPSGPFECRKGLGVLPASGQSQDLGRESPRGVGKHRGHAGMKALVELSYGPR